MNEQLHFKPLDVDRIEAARKDAAGGSKDSPV